jgi:hypothetical protein
METDVELLQGSMKATTDANDGTSNGDALHEEETDAILVSEQSLVAAPQEQLPTSEKHIYLTAKSKLHPVVDIQVPGYPSF